MLEKSARARSVARLMATLVVLTITGLGAQSNRPTPAPVPVTLAIAGRTNANVSLAAAGPFVAAGWAASLPSGSTDIYAALSRDSGGSFSTPVRVNAKAGDARAGGEQPPRVALISQNAGSPPAVVVVWTSKSDVGTTILSARSDDGARTFGTSTIVPNGEAPGMRGWESVTVDARGAVRVLWLDHREMAKPASDGPATEHNHAGHDSSAEAKRDGAAMAQQSKLYIATIGAPTSPRVLLGGVCFCCKTALATGPNQAIYAAWRHVYPGNVRDMAFTMSRDGGQTFASPTRISDDKWQLDGCPEDGPAIAVDAQNQIHVLWPTLVTDGSQGQQSIGIFYARSSDGRTFSARQRVATEGLPHHPQIQVAGDTLVLAWDELKDGKRRAIVAQRPLAAGPTAGFVRRVVSDEAPGVYPALAVSERGAIVAWTSTGGDSGIRVVRLAP